jgi:hypothetical protein
VRKNTLRHDAEQSDGHQAADRPLRLLETLLAAAGSSVAFATLECQMSARYFPCFTLLQFLLITILGCSNDNGGERKTREAVKQKTLAQRAVIDDLIRNQMKILNVRSSKQEFCATNKGSLFDSLIGEDIASYAPLLDCGDVVNDQYLSWSVLQKENVREWMVETGGENEYLAFKTDIWDFRTEGGVEFFDTLVVAIHDGKIVAYRFFAEAPY